MERTPEPELMDDDAQAIAYVEADFTEPHENFVTLFHERFGQATGDVVDLGCGSCDVTGRFLRRNPDAIIDGLDGAPAMLRCGQALLDRWELSERARLSKTHFPLKSAPERGWDTVISNSLLHHLHDPLVLWRTVAQVANPGARVFVMDLMRPADEARALAMVAQYAHDAPDVLRRDFHASLHAAFEPDEIRAQLREVGLELTVETVSDRHLIVWGHVANG